MAMVDAVCSCLSVMAGLWLSPSDWLGPPKVDGCLVLFCSHHANRVNFRNGFATMTALLVALLAYYY